MKPLRVPLLLAFAGAIALAVLFPRFDPAAKYPVTIDRAAAIQKAADWSAKLGVSVAGWRAQATHYNDDKVNRYRSTYPDDPAGRLFTPISWGVAFDSGRGQRVLVKLFGDGRPAEWTSSAPGAAVAEPATEIAGAFASRFSPDPNSADTAWQWSAGPQYPLAARIEVTRREDRLLAISLKPKYERGFGDTDATDVAMFFFGLFVVTGCLASVVFFALEWRAGGFTWRLPAGMLALFAIWWALQATGGWVRQDLAYDIGRSTIPRMQSGGGGASANPYLAYFAVIAGPLLMLPLVGAGYGLARNRYRAKWRSLETAIGGQLLRRQVALPAAAGALTGVAVAAFAYVVSGMTGAPLKLWGIEALGARAPEVAMPGFAILNLAAGCFGFGLPLALRFRARWLRLGLATLVVAAAAIAGGGRFDAFVPALLEGAAVALAGLWLWRAFDLLAVFSAYFALHAVLIPCVLLAQPVGSLRDSGVRALFVFGTFIAAAVYFAARGRDADAADLAAYEFDDAEGRARSSRERLEAEFQVARKAQQDALPPTPAPSAGFTFDAVCEPALQVGGDLYDFFPLPDGRLGAAVADVSGKGVPAALYMMVTKGLIGAAARDSGDLRHILHNLNLHLHKACKKKVFVTMAAVALDPESRRVEYGRAGHNPIVWRRERRGETLLLKPSGIGLGMCGAEMFSRALRLEQFELEPGDALVLYSDGVTEAVNPSMDQFGEERLMRAVEAADGGSAADIRQSILRELTAFAAGAPARDDVTVVAIRAPG